MFYLALILVLALDQTTKFMLKVVLSPNQSIPIIKNILNLTYVQNKGAAFGLFYGQQRFLLLVGILVASALFYYHAKIGKSDFMQVPLGLILGGSIGNISDRWLRHYVIDFIDFRIWPVFNFADIFINVGVLLIILRLFLIKEDKKYASRSS